MMIFGNCTSMVLFKATISQFESSVDLTSSLIINSIHFRLLANTIVIIYLTIIYCYCILFTTTINVNRSFFLQCRFMILSYFWKMMLVHVLQRTLHKYEEAITIKKYRKNGQHKQQDCCPDSYSSHAPLAFIFEKCIAAQCTVQISVGKFSLLVAI